MKPAYLIWDDLLQTIAEKRRSFCSVLSEGLLNGITRHSMGRGDGFQKEALLQWLLHLFATLSWKKAWDSSDDLSTTIMETCITHPGNWSKKLARAMLDIADDGFKDQWQPYFETSFLDISGSEDDASLNIDSQYNQDPNFKASTETDDQTSRVACPQTRAHHLRRSEKVHKSEAMSPETTKYVGEPKPGSGWRLWEGGWVPKPIGFPHPS
jgi:hypothetical protein